MYAIRSYYEQRDVLYIQILSINQEVTQVINASSSANANPSMKQDTEQTT